MGAAPAGPSDSVAAPTADPASSTIVATGARATDASDSAATGTATADIAAIDARARATDAARAATAADPSTTATGIRADDAQDLAREAALATSDRARRASATSDRAAQDPLARLLEGAELRDLRPVRPTSAVAGRLAEVEGSIARDRVAAALERATATDEAAPAPAAGTELPRTNASANNGAAPAFATAAAPTNAAPAAATLGAVADAATRAPASDLAMAPAADDAGQSPAAARLAAKGMELLASQRGGSITMRLEPPALGQLRIQLHVAQGAVVADFTAATAEARALLEANLGMLRERLESQGLSVERLTVHGGRGTDTAAASPSSQQGDARQDGTDARDRGDRGAGQGRDDAAGGESRGRRDGEPRRDGQDDAGARMHGGSGAERRGFASVLAGTAESRRAG